MYIEYMRRRGAAVDEERSMINHYALRCAQSKAAIAAFIGDGKMWIEAHAAMKKACDYPLYRRGKK